jgi:hypothetical protein
VDAQRKQCLVLFLIFYLNFIYLDFKLLFVCMNNNFNNLYESGGCISCAHIGAISGSGAVAGMPLKKNWAKSIIKWAALSFWDAVWEARLGKRRPHTKFSAAPKPASKSLAPVAVLGDEWRCS